jgi:hypothetical protein
MSLRVAAYPELQYEDIVGVPEEVVEDSTWLMRMPPLKYLTGLCLPGWHAVRVGEKWRWEDEQIRLDDEQVTDARAWLRAKQDWNRHTWRLPCPRCGAVTRMAAKGWEWA